MAYDPSGTVRVIGLGELLPPGTCIMCGSGSCDDGYVSVGAHIEWYGELYFCMLCVKEVGSAVGLFDPVEVEHLANTANESMNERDELREKLANATSDLDALRRAITIVNGVDLGSELLPEAESSDGPATGETRDDLTLFDNDGEDSDSGVNQSDSGDGPHDDNESERSDVSAIGL